MKNLILILALAGLMKAQAQAPSPADTTWTVKVIKSDEEWKKILSPAQYHITREEGTENPYTKGNYSDNHEKAIITA